MFQFRPFPSYAYLIQRTMTEYCSAGFPHSEIHGSRLMCSSPWLIAACHVLRRLLMPRHSPCALFSLIYVGVVSISLASAHCAKARSFRHASSFVPNPLRWALRRGDQAIWSIAVLESCRLHRSSFAKLKCYPFGSTFYFKSFPPAFAGFHASLLPCIFLCSVFKVQNSGLD